MNNAAADWVSSRRPTPSCHDRSHSSTSARAASFRPELVVNGQPTRVLVEQVGAVDVRRLGEHIGRVTIDEQWQIDHALLTVLGLD